MSKKALLMILDGWGLGNLQHCYSLLGLSDGDLSSLSVTGQR